MKKNCRLVRLFPLAMLMAATIQALAQNTSEPKPQVESPLTQLSWANDHQHAAPTFNDRTSEFDFAFTNISDKEIVIDHVKSSCSCTAAKLPAEPWHLPAHTNGSIHVSVNLKGKDGEFEKKVTIFFADPNTPPKELQVTVKMPDRTKMRSDNRKIAQADRQAVFKGDCAQCHAEPAKHYTGMALYHEICGVCHEARPRDSLVPDLRLIKQPPTDYTFWKTNIEHGKPGTLMPAFAISEGGPLTDEQIDMLAKAIDKAYPYARFANQNQPLQPLTPVQATPRDRVNATTAQKN
ncbi:MAG TPA: DUF1573 domain-containing protein [Verrucomicrobiae bacterium]|nr:DUF1573 domain-containing protein [Verrucomicrobiae bacterium]